MSEQMNSRFPTYRFNSKIQIIKLNIHKKEIYGNS